VRWRGGAASRSCFGWHCARPQSIPIHRLRTLPLALFRSPAGTAKFLSCALSPGYKIPVIENLGATLDQFDAIDFSDNEIRKLDGFPLLRRLKTLLMNNNRIW